MPSPANQPSAEAQYSLQRIAWLKARDVTPTMVASTAADMVTSKYRSTSLCRRRLRSIRSGPRSRYAAVAARRSGGTECFREGFERLVIKQCACQRIAKAGQKCVPGTDAAHDSQNQARGWIPSYESQPGDKNDLRPAQQKVAGNEAEGKECMPQNNDI